MRTQIKEKTNNGQHKQSHFSSFWSLFVRDDGHGIHCSVQLERCWYWPSECDWVKSLVWVKWTVDISIYFNLTPFHSMKFHSAICSHCRLPLRFVYNCWFFFRWKRRFCESVAHFVNNSWWKTIRLMCKHISKFAIKTDTFIHKR